VVITLIFNINICTSRSIK